ncbi:thiamine pyrophosphate enzyme [Aspergillus stella-maris]|uniref:thiamine pyrophosphate enzyme n=1 Tax=Aspergillus stella-maris TaxID=1810926 RepID=UPI003CCCC016
MPLKLAEYLFQRLRQLGISSIHGVPGDYNLTLLDYIEPAGLRWVGNVNELNAAYATDGYARIKGIGALITTFGVGELSARAGVVHIVGTPARAVQEGRALIHHTFNDGEYRRFARIHAEITVAQGNLWDPQMAPEEIDAVLQQCLIHSQPVYIEVPVDVVDMLVSGDRLGEPIRIVETLVTSELDAVLERILDRIYAAQRPVILIDGESRAAGIVEHIQTLVSTTKWPTWSTGYAKGLLDEAAPNFHGIYRGSYDASSVRKFFNSADLILLFGPYHSSSNTFGHSNIPNSKTTIAFTDGAVRMGAEVIHDMLDESRVATYTPYPDLPRDYQLSFSTTGTAGYGVREMPLPKDVRVFTLVTWLLIGYMLPAAQGAALAQQERAAASALHESTESKPRTILLIGNGSFRMTVQELGTIIRHNLNTIERCIHGRKQGYNDIGRWRYLQAPRFFGAREDTFTGLVKTWEELQGALGDKQVQDGDGLRMIEIVMDQEDAPQGPLLGYLEEQKKRESALG